MSHTLRDKKKLLNRIHRIRGQVDGVERLLLKEDDEDCFVILQAISACRGAINGLMSQVIEGHINEHVFTRGNTSTTAQEQAAQELIEVVRTYLK